MTKTDILNTIEAYKIYGKDNYLDNYIVKLSNALSASIELKGTKLNVTKI